MVRSLLTVALLACPLISLLGACDEDTTKQNETEHAVDAAGHPTRSPGESPGPYHLITELGEGDETVGSFDLCSLATSSPGVVAAVVEYVGPISDTRTDKAACVVHGIRKGHERAMQIVVTTDPDTNLEDSFGIDSRGYKYRSGPCLVTAAAYPTVDGYLAAAAQCDRGVWLAVASPAYPNADAAEVNAIIEASIKEL